MSEVDIDELATAIVKRLAGNLYTLPEEFKDNSFPYTSDYELPPIAIPGKHYAYQFTLRIRMKVESKSFDIVLYDVNGAELKRFSFI